MNASEPDPDDLARLTDRWAVAWARSRGSHVTRLGRAWRVRVAAETRQLEYVVASPTAAEAAQLVSLCQSDQEAWLTVLGPLHAEEIRALAPLEQLTHAEAMMTVDLAPGGETPGAVISEQDHVAHATIEIDGQEAARGQAALLGRDVVFDRVSTDPAFRRQGHGGTIMASLANWAFARGARRGILLASPDGQRLYTSLGWSIVAPVATYRRAR